MHTISRSQIPQLEQCTLKFDELYYKGSIKLLQKRKVAIVGSRRPNNYTRQFTHKIASELSKRDVVIVSGAAMGVDAIAHNACSNMQTIAIVANGLDIYYPAVNKKMIQTIEEKALILSPFKAHHKARAYNFVQRNELVVALSQALIITQADIDSGSMSSAKFALKHGIPIYVLPHRINESLGTQQLIKENKAQVIYDMKAFVEGFGKCSINEDEVIQYCLENPSFEKVYEKYKDRIIEYELEGKIAINNGLITVVA